MTPKEIWEQNKTEAYWDIRGVEDGIYLNCTVSLQVDGYEFSGYGVIVAQEKILHDLWCKTPEGVVEEVIV